MRKYLLVLIAFLFFCTSNAQDIIMTNDGNVIKGYNTDCSAKWVYYSLDSAGVIIKKIACEEILAIRKANGEKIVPGIIVAKRDTMIVREVSNVEYISDNDAEDAPIIDRDDYSGFLLDKGNCVCIPHNSEDDFERVGQNYIYKAVKQLGYWKVVNKPEQAHFIIYFGVDLRGRDNAFTWIGSVPFFLNEKGTDEQYEIMGNDRTDETVSHNLTLSKLHMLSIYALVKDLQQGKILTNLVIEKNNKK